MIKPEICCPTRSPEREEGPAAGSRQKMTGMGTGTARSGSRCQPLFLLLLLGSSCHMLHGQGVEEEVGDGGMVWLHSQLLSSSF
ncbi:hypothetical protein EPR50_G00013220 [Perca flavescens]|uniref:Uncharacterized protein n=1 Tax=Perca flavescens TaxID=8167 RepID=A0A484DKT9_PERFV|nr:hypothetical protein EPR50_G00013220 [Perca flavescens]